MNRENTGWGVDVFLLLRFSKVDLIDPDNYISALLGQCICTLIELITTVLFCLY